jgi:methyl-accepting chemotaxis protein
MNSNKTKRVPGLQQAQVLIYSVLFIMILSVGYGLFYNLGGIRTFIKENDEISTDFTEALIHLKGAFGYTGLIHNFKNYILRGTPNYLDAIKYYHGEVSMSIDHLSSSSLITDVELELLEIIQKKADEYRDAGLSVKGRLLNGASAESIDVLIRIDDADSREALNLLDLHYKKLISKNSEMAGKKVSSTLITFIGNSAVVVALFIFILVFVFRRLKKQIEAIGKVSKNMADGDLSKSITLIPNDSIGDLAENFNIAIASLKKIISGVVSTSDKGHKLNESLSDRISQIEISSGEMSNSLEKMHNKIKEENNQIIEASSALEEISANTSSLSKQISMQAESVSTTSAAVEEMAASILNVSRVADSRQNVTESLIIMTKEGSEKIEEANIIVQEAVKNMGAMQEMLEVINNITSQTNLLSMNAAIEAAHAGDAGKGFAVVADEIRKLAESTAENANEISDSLSGLINGINKTADVTKQSGDSFRKIEGEVRNFVQAFAEISASTRELSEGSREIQDSTISLLDITSNIKTGSEEMTLGANDINIALLRIKDASDKNTAGMATSREQIVNIYKAMRDIALLSSTNTDNMNTLREEVSVFTLDGNIVAGNGIQEELGVKTVIS